MVKYVVAVALLGTYAALATLVVRGEGRAYRDARRPKDRAPTVATRKQTAEAPPPPIAPPEVAGIDAKKSPALPVASIGAPPPAVAKTEPPRDPAPAPAPPPASAPDPSRFWKSERMKEKWDPAKLTRDEERRLGDALHRTVLELNKVDADGHRLERAEKAAEPLTEAGKKDVSYTFTILDSDAVNAFSHPGGYIYLTKGLFDFIGSDDEEDYVLQFIIAHEMAHLELGHAIKCLQDPDLSQSPFGTVPQFFLFLFPMGYLDAMDFAADRLAYDRMTGPLKRTRRESLAFLRRFKDYAERNEFRNGRAGLQPMPDASPLDNHMRAHPAARKRLDALMKAAAKPAR